MTMNANNENNYPNTNYPDFTATTTGDVQDDSTLSEHSQKQAIIGKQQDPLLENSTDTNNRNGGYLELLEERPVVNKERLDVGKVTVTKHFRTKTIDVPIELIEEYITVRTEYQDTQSQDLLSENYDDKDILRHV